MKINFGGLVNIGSATNTLKLEIINNFGELVGIGGAANLQWNKNKN